MTGSLVSTLGLTDSAARTSPRIPHNTVRDSGFGVNVRKQIQIGLPDHSSGVSETIARTCLSRMSINKSGCEESGISLSDDTVSWCRFAFQRPVFRTCRIKIKIWQCLSVKVTRRAHIVYCERPCSIYPKTQNQQFCGKVPRVWTRRTAYTGPLSSHAVHHNNGSEIRQL